MSLFVDFSFAQYGVEFTAEHVLPLLVPLLTATQLNVQQFAKYMLFVKDILRYIYLLHLFLNGCVIISRLTKVHAAVKSFFNSL